MVEIHAVTKTYRTPAKTVLALDAITLNIAAGEFVAVTGKSGSGKTTLCYLLAGLERPTSGKLVVDGMDLSRLTEDQLAQWRARRVGVVFQFFQLLPTLTVLENIMLPMELGERATWATRQARAVDLLEQVGLADRADAFPAEISGGEQQRVAIARALANDPPLLLADEPTGNLDSATAETIFQLFEQIVRQGRTLLIATHDREFASRATRRVHVVDGRLA